MRNNASSLKAQYNCLEKPMKRSFRLPSVRDYEIPFYWVAAC